jgi:hypothetical protein
MPKKTTAPPAPSPQPPASSLLVAGARLLDPAEGMDATGFVAIRDGRIEHAGPRAPKGKFGRTLEADGLWLLPGVVDLCARLREAGWRVVFAPVTEVVHAIGGSVSRKRFRMVVEHARSLDRFFGRRYATGVRRVARPLIRLGLVGWAFSVMAWSLLRGKTHAQAA